MQEVEGNSYCRAAAATEQSGLLKGPTAMIMKAHQSQQSSGNHIYILRSPHNDGAHRHILFKQGY